MPSIITSDVVSESAAKMPPLWNQRTPPAKIAFQSKSPGFSCAASLVAPVVEHHRRAHALAAIAVHRRHVRPVHAVVLEVLIERLHAHRPHALGDQIADGIIHHRGSNPGLHAETVGQVGGAVELSAAHVDLALRCLAERDDPGVQAVYQRAQRDKIQRSFSLYIQPVLMFSPKPCMSPPTRCRPCRSSWCGRTCRAAGRPARRCVRRSNRAAPAAGWPEAVRCGSRRRTRAPW